MSIWPVKLPSWLNSHCRFPTNLTNVLLYFSSSNILLLLLHNKIHPSTLFCQLNGFKCEDTAVGNVRFELKVTKSSDTMLTYNLIQLWGWYQCDNTTGNNGGLRVATFTCESFMCRWAVSMSHLQWKPPHRQDITELATAEEKLILSNVISWKL